MVFNYNSEKVQLATSVLQMAIVGELEEVHTQYSYNITLECNLKMPWTLRQVIASELTVDESPEGGGGGPAEGGGGGPPEGGGGGPPEGGGGGPPVSCEQVTCTQCSYSGYNLAMVCLTYIIIFGTLL